jgi:hypothetical protein
MLLEMKQGMLPLELITLRILLRLLSSQEIQERAEFAYEACVISTRKID